MTLSKNLELIWLHLLLMPYFELHFILFQIVNFGSSTVNLKISVQGLELNSKSSSSSKKTVLTSPNLMDENSFAQPNKVDVVLSPHSFTSIDLLTVSTITPWTEGDDSFFRSSL